MSDGQMNAWQLLILGGPLMIPLCACSVIALAIVIEKIIYFSKISINIFDFKVEVFEALRNNRLKDAIAVCESTPSPVGNILKAGILKFGSSRDEIRQAIEDASLFELPKFERRLPALSAIAHIAPLFGLLGTVLGMAQAFYMIQIRSNSMNPATSADLAGGMWQALLTTVAGLTIAIPCFLAYNYCINRVNHFVLEMERTASELTTLLGHLSEVNVEHEEESL